MKKRILVVEDDVALARIVSDNFTFEGFLVRIVNDGRLAIDTARDFSPDLIVLDVMLPGQDGFELCGLLRRQGQTPIIMLTARVQKSDKLRCLNLGADDYVTKPFDLEELLARVHAVLRRTRPTIDRLVLGDVTVDFTRHAGSKGSTPLRMTHREFDLLRYLAERADRVVYRNELLRDVWGYPDAPNTRSVDHAIARLRKKIEDHPHHPRFIHTVHGDGYVLTPEGSTETPPAPARP
jgi:DNA-binding response OmpR family regulator